jgi:hypothetical protein
MVGLERHARRLVQRREGVDHRVDETIGARQADVERVVAVVLHASVLRRVTGFDEAELLGFALAAQGDQVPVARFHRADGRA